MYPNAELYSRLIELLMDEFKDIFDVNCSKFEAVLLTVPDADFTWRDVHNDNPIHFLNPVKNEIENANYTNLFEIITHYADRLKSRAHHSLQCVYTYNDYQYVESMFRNIIKRNEFDDVALFRYAITFLKHFYYDTTFNSFLNKCGLDKCINLLESNDFATDENKLRDLFVCLNKVFCAVIIYSAQKDEPDDLDVCPSTSKATCELFRDYEKIKIAVIDSPADNEEKFSNYLKLKKFMDFYGMDNEMRNFIANKFYDDFFNFINDCSVQNEFVFGDIEDIEARYEMLELYRMFDRHMKYALYRKHRTLGKNDGKGLMRNSLTERKIVLDYLKKRKNDITSEISFSRLGFDGRKMQFILRLAKKEDFDTIHKINNPSEPYRRAIFVKSDDNEIEKAIQHQEAYVIEEMLNGNRILACVAIILNSKNDHSDYHTEELCGRYAKKFNKKYGRKPIYLDFDSVITNNGSAGIGKKSYRGLAFQRLMLVLTEELAHIEECDYISATVSSFNEPSKRNFELNGYEVANSDRYPFNGDGNSEYWDYISEHGNEDKKRIYLDMAEKEYADHIQVMKKQNITKESYIFDKDVPRDFLVLSLTEKIIQQEELNEDLHAVRTYS